MKETLNIQLPNLFNYRREFALQGIRTPLPTVSFSNKGLLAELPPPPVGKTGWPWTVETQPPAMTMPNGLPWPKVSITTPSYNQGCFIEETIRSVLLQNYPNLEYAICDGGSSDETVEILEKYSPWLSFWQSKKDQGQGHAINLGFSIASGDYFGWINSDDFYLPNCFQKVANYFCKHSLDFVYGDALNFSDGEPKIHYWQGYLVLDRYLRFGGLVASHAAFWKSTIHMPIWEEMNCNVDGELWIRLLPGRSKGHLQAPLGVCRLQPQSKSIHDRYRSLWKKDSESIAAVYGLPPQPRSSLAYEFVLVQRTYQYITRHVRRRRIESSLQRHLWTNQFSFAD